jgi:hypothetical protein
MQQPKTEKKENESVKGLRIVLDALKKSGHGPESEAAKKINALIKKYE